MCASCGEAAQWWMGWCWHHHGRVLVAADLLLLGRSMLAGPVVLGGVSLVAFCGVADDRWICCDILLYCV